MTGHVNTAPLMRGPDSRSAKVALYVCSDVALRPGINVVLWAADEGRLNAQLRCRTKEREWDRQGDR